MLYTELLSDSIACPVEKQGVCHVYHQYTIRNKKRNKIQQRLKEQGVSSVVYYPVPLHMQEALKFLATREAISRKLKKLPVKSFLCLCIRNLKKTR